MNIPSDSKSASSAPLHRTLVLASTSVFRRELLNRLGLPFITAAPRIDERRLDGETPEAMALRLSESKARALAGSYPDALIIGSDQVAILDGQVFGKPGNFDNAKQQLQAMSGRTVNFFTSICLFDARDGSTQTRGVPTLVTFRHLTDSQIERYLHREQPYQCAGAAKSEGLGIALIQCLQGDDPNALIGLPLIALCDLLHNVGLNIV